MKEELIEYDDINFVNVKEEVGHVKGWNWGDIRIKEEVVEDDGDDNLCIGNNDLNDPLDLKETDPTIVNLKYPETDIVHSKLNDKIDNKETLCPRVDLTTSYYVEPDGTDTNFELDSKDHLTRIGTVPIVRLPVRSQTNRPISILPKPIQNVMQVHLPNTQVIYSSDSSNIPYGQPNSLPLNYMYTTQSSFNCVENTTQHVSNNSNTDVLVQHNLPQLQIISDQMCNNLPINVQTGSSTTELTREKIYKPLRTKPRTEPRVKEIYKPLLPITPRRRRMVKRKNAYQPITLREFMYLPSPLRKIAPGTGIEDRSAFISPKSKALNNRSRNTTNPNSVTNLSAERLKTSVESCLSNFRKIAPRTSATTVTDKTNCPAATPPTVDCDNNDNAGDNSNQEYYVQIKEETRNNLQNSTSFVHDNNSVSGQETDIQNSELYPQDSGCQLFSNVLNNQSTLITDGSLVAALQQQQHHQNPVHQLITGHDDLLTTQYPNIIRLATLPNYNGTYQVVPDTPNNFTSTMRSSSFFINANAATTNPLLLPNNNNNTNNNHTNSVVGFNASAAGLVNINGATAAATTAGHHGSQNIIYQIALPSSNNLNHHNSNNIANMLNLLPSNVSILPGTLNASNCNINSVPLVTTVIPAPTSIAVSQNLHTNNNVLLSPINRPDPLAATPTTQVITLRSGNISTVIDRSDIVVSLKKTTTTNNRNNNKGDKVISTEEAANANHVGREKIIKDKNRISRNSSSSSTTTNLKEKNTSNKKKRQKKPPSNYCVECDQKFSSRWILNTHMQHRHENVRPFVCNYCDKKFPYKSSLSLHIKLHLNVKPHECYYCDKRFVSRSSLLMHVPVHTAQRPYGCDYCDKWFCSRRSLTLHIRRHTVGKPFECVYCQKRFYGRSQLSTHTRTHTKEKPFICFHCEKRFNLKCSLAQHIAAIHMPLKRYRCNSCSLCLQTLSSMAVHLMRVHNCRLRSRPGRQSSKFYSIEYG